MGDALPQMPKLTSRGIVAATSGNILEWYDFTAYGFMAPIIGAAFFPQGDTLAATLSAFAVLAVGYLARPIGSLVFGHIGDRIGRKPALLVSVVLMGVSAFAIGLLPTYAEIGVVAPVLLVVLRILQGIAVAGEYTASGILVVESAPPRARNFAGSWIAFAMILGCVIGSGVPALVSSQMSAAALADWGWRIPFFFGGLVALTSLIMRLGLPESRQEDAADQRDFPLLDALRGHWREILSMVVLIMPIAILYFLIFVYASTYLTQHMHVSTATALDFSTANLLVIAALIVPVGLLADRIGARPLLLGGAVATLVGAYPLWSLMHASDLTLAFAGQTGFAVINTVGWALSVSVLAGMVPAAVRCSAVSIGYNAAMAIFGGTTPLVATYLVARTSDDFAPVIYLLGTTVLSLVVIWRLPARPTPDATTS